MLREEEREASTQTGSFVRHCEFLKLLGMIGKLEV
jgi:hypothetical protein